MADYEELRFFFFRQEAGYVCGKLKQAAALQNPRVIVWDAHSCKCLRISLPVTKTEKISNIGLFDEFSFINF